MSRGYFEIAPEIQRAVKKGQPVVALESTLISHGLPRPQNFETALALETAVRREGALPVTVGIAGGRLVIGLTEEEIRELAEAAGVLKVSRRGLAAAVASGGLGATTVSATMWAAKRTGIRVMATGGIGGVHRGGESSFDISTDLTELGRTRVGVVCSGAKAILDLERTVEMLETQGVPVVGFRTDTFPAFYSKDSGRNVPDRVDSAQEAAARLAAHWGLGVDSGVLIVQPPPADRALDREETERWIATALEEATARGIRGESVTPFLLARLAELSDGQTLETNRALLVANAALAARIAVEWSEL